jgi:hypothetical protein
MFNFLKKILSKKQELELTPIEVKYKNDTLNQVNKLLEGALRDNPNEWEKLQPKLSAELDEKILIARNLGKTPQQVEQERVDEFNAELNRKREILKNGYSLSVEDYKKIVAPIFEKFEFFPQLDMATFSGERAIDLLYLVSNSNYHTSKDAQDQLMGFCDTYAVAEVAKAVRARYELARRCELAGVSKVRLIVSRKCCEKCKALDETEISTANILDEFNSGEIAFPHSIPNEDTADYCLGPTMLPIEI